MYKLELSDQQLSVINDALMQMPYHLAAPLIAHINQQIQEQRIKLESTK
jgi:hypothetical protein